MYSLWYCSCKKKNPIKLGDAGTPLTVSVWRFNTRFKKEIYENGKQPISLKILYKCIIADTGTICKHALHIPPPNVYSSPNRSKTTTQEPDERAYLSNRQDLGK